MNTEGFQLPEYDPSTYSVRRVYLKEWVTDPPPWIIGRIPDELVSEMLRIKMEGLAEIAQIESQKLAIEEKVFRSIAKILKF